MARVDLPRSGLRQRRRKRRWLLVAALAVACLAVVGGFVWLSWARFLRVTSVEVLDAKTVASSTITTYVQQELSGAYGWLFARSNIFLYPRKTIERTLRYQYPTLREVDVHAKDFHTVVVKVTERQPVALWCDTTCFYMDEEGLVYAPAPQFNEQVYISYSGSTATTSQENLRQFLTHTEFQSLAALVQALIEKEPDNLVRHVAVDASGDVRAYFHDDFLLMFNLKDDGGDVFERFSLALTSEVFAGKTLASFEYLDLRFGDKLYYKLK